MELTLLMNGIINQAEKECEAAQRYVIHGDSVDHPYAYWAGAGVREIFMRDQRKFFSGR